MPNKTLIEQLIQSPIIKNINDLLFIKYISEKDNTTLIYLPELGNEGITFVNKFRKKGVFNEAIILPMYKFFGKKISSASYIKEFREKNPNVRIVKKLKPTKAGKVNIMDLTILSELFAIQSQKFKFRAMDELFRIIDDLIKTLPTGTTPIFLYDSNSKNGQNNLFFDLFFQYVKRNSFKIPYDKIPVETFLGFYQDDKFIHLAAFSEKIKMNFNGKEQFIHKFKVPTLINFQKEFLNLSPEEDAEDITLETLETDKKDTNKNTKANSEETSEETVSNQTTENEVDPRDQVKQDLNNLINILTKGQSKDKVDDLLKDVKSLEGKKDLNEDTLDEIYQYLSRLDPNKDINEIIEKLKEIYKNDKKFITQLDLLINYINEINKKYNGSIKLDENLINKTSNNYYNPVDILGMDTLNVYNRQKTEFDYVLDNNMYDLIKSIEKDKEAGVEVLKIETELVDNNKDRYKKYIVTLKNKNFGYTKKYKIEFLVPYPVKNKYIKMDGNTYIMLNQFFPKPIVKIKPNLTRLYTHYNTSTMTLNTHVYNEKTGMDNVLNILSKMFNKHYKTSFYDDDEYSNVLRNTDDFNITPFDSFTKSKIEFEFEVKTL